MRVGDLNKRLELQATTKTSDGMGGTVNVFQTMATVWGSLWPLRGDELVESMKLSATITHRVRIRFRRDVRASWRIKYGTRLFSISAPPINMGEEGRWLELMVREAV